MDGALLIHKPAGMTSHDVVHRLRNILHIRRIGHSGTLDPQASGVLLVLVGKACKALPFLQDTDKEYVAQLQLGTQTLSDDIWGEVIKQQPIRPIEDFQALLDTFRGKQLQVPPLISSIKIKGKKLYEYARAKETITPPQREIEIYDIEALDDTALRFRVHCSSGTYVRALCRDMAIKSGNVGCMAALVRTKVGRFTLEDCVSLADVEQGCFRMHPLTEILAHYEQVEVAACTDVYNGRKLRLACANDEVLVLYHGEALAIYARENADMFRSVRGLW